MFFVVDLNWSSKSTGTQGLAVLGPQISISNARRFDLRDLHGSVWVPSYCKPWMMRGSIGCTKVVEPLVDC
jgi:hypothetical protein